MPSIALIDVGLQYITVTDVTDNKRNSVTVTKPANFGLHDCQCMHCKQNRGGGNKLIINHGQFKHIGQLSGNEVNRQTLPGDVDYVGVAI